MGHVARMWKRTLRAGLRCINTNFGCSLLFLAGHAGRWSPWRPGARHREARRGRTARGCPSGTARAPAVKASPASKRSRGSRSRAATDRLGCVDALLRQARCVLMRDVPLWMGRMVETVPRPDSLARVRPEGPEPALRGAEELRGAPRARGRRPLIVSEGAGARRAHCALQAGSHISESVTTLQGDPGAREAMIPRDPSFSRDAGWGCRVNPAAQAS